MSAHDQTTKDQNEKNLEALEQNSPFESDPNAQSKPKEEVDSDLGGLVDPSITDLEDGT